MFCRFPRMSCPSYLPPNRSAIVTGSAYLLLHLSALECLNSFADCLTYYAVC